MMSSSSDDSSSIGTIAAPGSIGSGFNGFDDDDDVMDSNVLTSTTDHSTHFLQQKAELADAFSMTFAKIEKMKRDRMNAITDTKIDGNFAQFIEMRNVQDKKTFEYPRDAENTKENPIEIDSLDDKTGSINTDIDDILLTPPNETDPQDQSINDKITDINPSELDESKGPFSSKMDHTPDKKSAEFFDNDFMANGTKTNSENDIQQQKQENIHSTKENNQSNLVQSVFYFLGKKEQPPKDSSNTLSQDSKVEARSAINLESKSKSSSKHDPGDSNRFQQDKATHLLKTKTAASENGTKLCAPLNEIKKTEPTRNYIDEKISDVLKSQTNSQKRNPSCENKLESKRHHSQNFIERIILPNDMVRKSMGSSPSNLPTTQYEVEKADRPDARKSTLPDDISSTTNLTQNTFKSLSVNAGKTTASCGSSERKKKSSERSMKRREFFHDTTTSALESIVTIILSSDSDSCHSVQRDDKANKHSHEQSSTNKTAGHKILSLDTTETLVTSEIEKRPKHNDTVGVVHKHDHDLAIFSEKVVQFLKRNNISSCKKLLQCNVQKLADALSRDEMFLTSTKAVNEFILENSSCFALSCVKKWKEKVQSNIKNIKMSDDESIDHDQGMRYIEEFLAPSHTKFLKDYFGISTALALLNSEAESIANKLSDVLESTKSFVGDYKDQREAFCNGMVVSWFDTVTENLKNGNPTGCNAEKGNDSKISSQHNPKTSNLSPDVQTPTYPYGSPYSHVPNSGIFSRNRLYNEHTNDHPSPYWHRYHGPADRYTYSSYNGYYSAHRRNFIDNQVYNGRYNPSQNNNHHYDYPRHRNHNYMNLDNRQYRSYRSGFYHEKKSPEICSTQTEQVNNHQGRSLGSYDNTNHKFPKASISESKQNEDLYKKGTVEHFKSVHDDEIQNKSNFQMESQNLSRGREKVMTKKRKIDSSKSQPIQKTKKQEIDKKKTWNHTFREDDVYFLLSQGIDTNKNLAQANPTLLAFHYDKFRSLKGAQQKGDSRIIAIAWVRLAQKLFEKGKIRHLVRDARKFKTKISEEMSMNYVEKKKVKYNSMNHHSLTHKTVPKNTMPLKTPCSSELQTEEMPLLDNVKHLCKLTTSEQNRLPQKIITSYDCINGE